MLGAGSWNIDLQPHKRRCEMFIIKYYKHIFEVQLGVTFG